MARIMGDLPSSTEKRVIYDFAVRSLPDYIYVIFGKLRYEQRSVENDALLIIPHLGVISLEICNGQITFEKGRLVMQCGNDTREWKPRHLLRDRFAVNDYLKSRFNITPFVFNIVVFPSVRKNEQIKNALRDEVSADCVLFLEDFQDPDLFLLKIHECCCREKKDILVNSDGRYRFSDLTDTMAYNVFTYFDTGMQFPQRPARPPLVFLSYSSNNATAAGEIQEHLEKQGVFVWQAPDDVAMGEYYRTAEEKAIALCDEFLILLSTPAQESDEVKFEFEEARKRGKKILPVRIENCEINDYYKTALEKIQYRTMERPDPVILDEIVRIVRNAADPQQET